MLPLGMFIPQNYEFCKTFVCVCVRECMCVTSMNSFFFYLYKVSKHNFKKGYFRNHHLEQYSNTSNKLLKIICTGEENVLLPKYLWDIKHFVCYSKKLSLDVNLKMNGSQSFTKLVDTFRLNTEYYNTNGGYIGRFFFSHQNKFHPTTINDFSIGIRDCNFTFQKPRNNWLMSVGWSLLGVRSK